MREGSVDAMNAPEDNSKPETEGGGVRPAPDVEMADATEPPKSTSQVKAEDAPQVPAAPTSPSRAELSEAIKVERPARSSTPPRLATSLTAIRARTRSTSPPSAPASIATAPSVDGKASASPSLDAAHGPIKPSSGTEVDKEKLLATIEMTKKANLLQQRLALAGFKAQHGWSELSIGDIEPKLATVPPPPQSPGLAPPATPLRKRKSHTSLSIASPTDRDAPGVPFRSPNRASFSQGSPLRSSFPAGIGIGSPTRAGFPSPGGHRDRRLSASGRPRVAYVSPHRDRRPSGSFAEGIGALQPPLSPTSPTSPRKRSRTGNSPGSPTRSAQHHTMADSLQNGNSPYARRRSDPSRSPSPPPPAKRYAEHHRRPAAIPYGLDYVAEEQGNRASSGPSANTHRRVVSTSGSQFPPANGQHLHPLAASPSLPPPRAYREEHRKKQRSQSHSGFHLMQGQPTRLPPSTDAMDVDAANALTSMLGSGSSRGNSPAFSPTASFAVPRFPDQLLDNAPISPASNLALRNSVAAQKPRAQSFAAMSRKFSGSGSPSPSISHARPSYAQMPSSNARGGHSAQSSRRPSDDAAIDDQESEDEAKEAAELMIFLAQSPSPARNVARKRSAQHLSGTPGGVGRVLFEETTGTHAGDTFSPSRFANLMIQSPREGEFGSRVQASGSAAGDRMRMALESDGMDPPRSSDGAAPARMSRAEGESHSRHNARQPQPLSATTSIDSGDEPVTPMSSAVRSHESFSAPGVKA